MSKKRSMHLYVNPEVLEKLKEAKSASDPYDVESFSSWVVRMAFERAMQSLGKDKMPESRTDK